MQTVSASFTTMSQGAVRNPIAEVEFAWDRTIDPSITLFTVGVSTIGGTDIIAGEDDAIGDVFRYTYTDESDYLILAETDRTFNEPFNTIVRAAGDVILDNITGRFTPNGGSAIDDYIKQGRPLKIYFGFDYGSRELVQGFHGQINEIPEVDTEDRSVRFHALDIMDVVLSTVIGESAMLTNIRTDLAMASLLEDAGLAPGQYDLDEGNQTIPFIYFQVGEKLSDIFTKLLQVETGIFYLNEAGSFIFDNQRRRSDFPVTPSVLTIDDSYVINERDRNIDTIINSVAVNAKPRAVAANQMVFELASAQTILAGESFTFWINYDDPMYAITTPTAGGGTSNYAGVFTGSGSDATASLSLATFDNFAQATKVVVTNNHGSLSVNLTAFEVWGQPATVTDEIAIIVKDQTSIDEYGEHSITIENDYIQDRTFADELADRIIADRKDPYTYIDLTIRGLPQLQIGDVVTRNSLAYEIVRIVQSLTPDNGFIQRLWLRR